MKRLNAERGKRHDALCQGCKKRNCRFLSVMQRLKKRGMSHTRGYYHYTRLNDLIQLIQHPRLTLSRVDTMNDGTEKSGKSDRTYVLSFSIGDEESVAMWSTYGIPRKEAIRIRFPYNAFETLLAKKNSERFGLRIFVKGVETQHPACRVRLQDVCYVNNAATVFKFGNHEVTIKDTDCPLDSKNRREMLSSYWKKSGWSYERETRLVVEFNEPLEGSPKKIDIDFTVPFQSMFLWKGKTASIAAGPWLGSEHVRNRLSCVKGDSELCRMVRAAVIETRFVVDSQYRGHLHLQRKRMNCASCKKEICDYYEGE